jgi:hypothetical protein
MTPGRRFACHWAGMNEPVGLTRSLLKWPVAYRQNAGEVLSSSAHQNVQAIEGVALRDYGLHVPLLPKGLYGLDICPKG